MKSGIIKHLSKLYGFMKKPSVPSCLFLLITCYVVSILGCVSQSSYERVNSNIDLLETKIIKQEHFSVTLELGSADLYNGPSETYEKVETIYSSKQLRAINETNSWIQIVTGEGHKGWIKKNWMITYSSDQMLSHFQKNNSGTKDKEKQNFPSDIDIKVDFSDKISINPNNTIDAGERSVITAKLTNQGKGTALDVIVHTVSKIFSVNVSSEIQVGDIIPGGTKEITIDINAGIDLADGMVPFSIVAKEKRGYDSKTYNLNVPAVSLQRPDLQIANYKINDGNIGLASGNGNGIPENGETIEIVVFVKNNGVGKAIKVNLEVTSITAGINLVNKNAEIAEIFPGQTEKGSLAFTIPRTYFGSELTLALLASDVRQGASEARQDAALNVDSHRPVLAYTYRIIDHNGRQVQTISNGWEGELEITPANNGRMEASGISLDLSSSEISIPRDHTNIDRISAESKYVPQRFAFSVPRKLEKSSVDVKVKFDQLDFAGLSDSIHIPVNLVLPDFEISHQVLDPNNNGVIEQGETIDLIVTIKNTGRLDADNVKIRFDFDKDGVKFNGSKEVAIGRVAAGETSSAKTFTINMTRRTTPGSLPINFTIDQKDFSSKNISIALNIVEEQAEVINVAGQEKPMRAISVAATASIAMPPMVFIATPYEEARVASRFETVSGMAGDDKGIANIEVKLNGRRLETDRGVSVEALKGVGQKQRNFKIRVPLEIGRNEIEVTAFDVENLSASIKRVIYREAEKGEIYAAVIGIDEYQHVPKLDYASKDARSFAKYMRENMGLDSDHLFELYDGQATKLNVESLLGNELPRKADKPEDTVIIFFAGHGAPEKDSTSRDGDSISKYLLTNNSDMNNLYGTAINMDAIARIFSRIRADRVIFIADACYSGGSGGRTVLAQGWRAANISDKFLDRIANAGKGRIILTSSSAQEVSQESTELGHGYFTYYLLEGLQGAADIGGDGEVDVDEIYQYLNMRVADATNGSQHPMKKGEAEGRVIIGRVR